MVFAIFNQPQVARGGKRGRPAPRKGTVVTLTPVGLLTFTLRTQDTALEVELADIVLVKDGGRPQQDDPICANCVVPQSSRGEGLPLLASNLSLDKGSRSVIRQVAQFPWVPQGKLLHCTILHVFAHLVWRSQASEGDFAAFIHRFDGTGSCRDAYGRRRDDALQISIR